MVRAVLLAVTLALTSTLVPLGMWMPASAQEATPAADCPVTTGEENRAIVQRYNDLISAGNLEAVSEVLAPVVYMHAVDVADARGVDEYIATLAVFTSAFPDLRHEVQQLISDEDFVVARVVGSGTHLGEFVGIPPTGREATWTIIAISRIECGRIAEQWVEVDAIGRLVQLGLIPGPGAAAGTPTSETTTEMAASPAAECPTTTEEQNEALVRRWYDEVYSQKNFDTFDEIIAPDHLRHGLNRDTTGAEARQAAVQVQQTAFPDVAVEPDFLLSEGDLVVARWTSSGTHTGPWENIAPSGNAVTWTGNTIYRIECGRIAEEWAEVDGLAFFEGIGVIEWPPAQPEASPASG